MRGAARDENLSSFFDSYFGTKYYGVPKLRSLNKKCEKLRWIRV